MNLEVKESQEEDRKGPYLSFLEAYMADPSGKARDFNVTSRGDRHLEP